MTEVSMSDDSSDDCRMFFLHTICCRIFFEFGRMLEPSNRVVKIESICVWLSQRCPSQPFATAREVAGRPTAPRCLTDAFQRDPWHSEQRRADRICRVGLSRMRTARQPTMRNFGARCTGRVPGGRAVDAGPTGVSASHSQPGNCGGAVGSNLANLTRSKTASTL